MRTDDRFVASRPVPRLGERALAGSESSSLREYWSRGLAGWNGIGVIDAIRSPKFTPTSLTGFASPFEQRRPAVRPRERKLRVRAGIAIARRAKPITAGERRSKAGIVTNPIRTIRCKTYRTNRAGDLRRK